MTRLRPRLGAVLLALLATAPAAAQQVTQVGPLYPGARIAAPQPRPAPVDTLGLRMRIGDGERRGLERAPQLPSRQLDAASAARLLSRLRPITAAVYGDSFAFPAQTFPAPRAGNTVLVGFPPRDSAQPRPTVERAPLVVTRFAPEGEVPLGAEVTVTFSRPMIPLSTVGAADARPVPVRMTPTPAGRWRWLDVRTARFEPQGRLPMATTFQLEVPAGTRAADGSPLGEAVRWSFGTPAPRVLGGWPYGGPTGLEPVMVAGFDGRIDRAAVLQTIHVRVAGREVPVRLATAAELAADVDAKARLESLDADRWIAFRPVRPLPRNASVEVRIGPGTPSLEGPRRTEDVQAWSFSTYPPFRITGSRCGWGNGCRPGMPLLVMLSTAVASPDSIAKLIQVAPAIPDQQVRVSGSFVTIWGRTQPNTAYTVSLSPGVRDVFGQTLTGPPTQQFRVGAPVAGLGTRHPGHLVLDPMGTPTLSLFANDHPRLRLRIHRVPAERWGAYVDRPRDGSPAVLPGTEVVDRVIALNHGVGVTREVPIDLAPVLDGGVGLLLVAVEAMQGQTLDERRQSVYLWVQATRIGLTTAADPDSLTVWATSLVDGAPLPGVELTLHADGIRGTTGASGLASLALPRRSTPPEAPRLIARRGGDVAVLWPGLGAAGWGSWLASSRRTGASFYAFTDRNLYRPGETVRFKGWVRRISNEEHGTVRLAGHAGQPLQWVAHDERGNELAKGTTTLSALEGFDAKFDIPAGSNLGDGRITVTVGGESHSLPFLIQEFRRPEYEVSVTAQPGPHFVGGFAEIEAKATYFAGGGLPGATVNWLVMSTPGFYAPPGWEQWIFGMHRPWWMWYGGDDESTQVSHRGETDASGSHVARLSFDSAKPARPYSVTVNATVVDVNRQTWNSATSLLVHPASVYLGIRTNRAWLQAGDTLELDLMAVDLDGRPVAGRAMELTARRFVWRVENNQWSRVEAGRESCTRASGDAPVGCTFPALQGGDWEIVASTTDDRGRVARTEMRLWVTGPGIHFPRRDQNDTRTVDLVPDKDEYRPGDTARVMVRLPFSPARGVLSIRRNGVVSTQPFSAAENTHVLRVPISENDLPNLDVQVDLVGATDGGQGDLPTARGVDVATASTSLKVSLATRTLTVRPVPADSASEPDAPGAVEVTVQDHAGRPVAGAEVVLVGVDEAVLALTGYRLGNPLDEFYPQRGTGATDVRLHPLVQVVVPDLRPAPGTLVGRILSVSSGDPIGGARVSIEGDTIATLADANGRFRLRGVRGGRVVVVVELGGYQPLRQPVDVVAGGTPVLRLYLTSAEEAEDEMVAQGRAAGARFRVGGIVANEMAAPAMAAPPPPPPPPSPEAKDGAPPPQIAIRSNFDPLAFWVPVGRTDATGRLRATFTLPSNLTRYRVSAVAVEGGTRFGLGESAITARKPLMARPSAPRFLNYGDRFEMPVVVQNGTGQALTVQVAARGDGISFTEPGRTVTVPAFDRAEVRIPAEAVRAGPAHVQVVIAGGTHTDAAEIEIPVYTPATSEAFAVYGQLTEGAAVLPLEVPRDAIPAFGGLEVTTSSTALQELTDAFLYLIHYPFECAEQKASRVMAVAALRDVLKELNAAGLPSDTVIQASMRADLQSLAALQNPDGGWSFWPGRDRRSWPYISIHVAHALERARAAGFQPDPQTWARALNYLRRVPNSIEQNYSPETRRVLHAYALYTRDRMGDRVSGDVRDFLRRYGVSGIGLEEAGWLLSVAAKDAGLAVQRDSLLRLINNRATETPSTATFATRYTEGEYLLLHSDRRTDAIVLEGLLAADPRSELATKTVRGLLGHRTRGRWESTQENSWVLLALNRYFREYEAQTPDFVARVWLGDRYAGGAEFRGRSGDRAEIRVPMRALQELDPSAITIGHQGTGRLYWRAGLRYAPRDLDVTPLQRGFAVERTYEAVDDTADVMRGADGIWRVKAGARVRVTVTMTAPSRRVHVALVDPMPAGWEPVNPELRGTEPEPSEAQGRRPMPVDVGRGWSWRWWWFEHQNLRDDRAEAFTSLLPAGVYTYTYTARATTPGIYIVPPPRAEEMYSPETFGRGATERVIVQ